MKTPYRMAYDKWGWKGVIGLFLVVWAVLSVAIFAYRYEEHKGDCTTAACQKQIDDMLSGLSSGSTTAATGNATLCGTKDSDYCSHDVNDTPVPGVTPVSAASTPSKPEVQQPRQIVQTAAQPVASASPLLAIEQLSVKSGVPSLCASNETTVWSGVKGAKVYSLCASQGLGAAGGYMQYRAGKVGRVEFKYPSTLVNPHGYFALSVLAHSVELEFKNGDFTYDIREQANGSATEIDVSKSNDSTFGASIVMTQATTTLGTNPTMDLFKTVGDAEGF